MLAAVSIARRRDAQGAKAFDQAPNAEQSSGKTQPEQRHQPRQAFLGNMRQIKWAGIDEGVQLEGESGQTKDQQ